MVLVSLSKSAIGTTNPSHCDKCVTQLMDQGEFHHKNYRTVRESSACGGSITMTGSAGIRAERAFKRGLRGGVAQGWVVGNG